MIFVLIAALALRLVNINQSLWLDETVQVITSAGTLSGVFQELAGDFHPPLYHLWMWGWVHLAGNSEVTVRLPSVLFGVFTVYLVYQIAKQLKLKKPWVAGLLMATAPFHIYYSQEARAYSLSALLSTLPIYFLLKLDSKTKARDLLLFLLSAAALVYTDYYGWFVVLASGLYLLLKKRPKLLALISVILLAAYVPWIPSLARQLTVGSAATVSLPSWASLVNLSSHKALPLTLLKFTIGRITVFDKNLYFLVFLTLAVVVGYLLAKALRSAVTSRSPEKILILLWLAVPVFLAWAISLAVPNYQPFRLLLVLPAFYLALALGLDKTKLRFILPVLLAINLICSAVYFLNPYFHREDWRGTVNYLKIQQNAVALLPSDTSAWPWFYYQGGTNLLAGSQGISMVKNVLPLNNETRDIYYIRYLVPVFDPHEYLLKGLGESGYNKVQEISFNQISVWKFVKP